MQGCANVWSPKALRSAGGAHFRVPILNSIPWEEISSHISPTAHVLLADCNLPNHQVQEAKITQSEMITALQKKCEGFKTDNGKDLSYVEPDILEEYSRLPLETLPISKLDFVTAKNETVLVLGGETHGLSLMAKKLALDNNGASIYVPLRNQMESLNVACAASVILYQFLLQLDKKT